MSNFLQLTISGVALGFQYALVALSLVVILKASGVLSILQGGMALLGAYVTYAVHQQLEIPFALAVLIAVLFCAVVNIAVERSALRRVGAHSELVIVFLTFGMLLVLEPIVEAIWGGETLDLGDPWAFDTVQVGSLSITQRDLWAVGIGMLVLGLTYLVFTYTRLGLSMRANASDTEAAAAQGINPNTVLGASWGIAGALGGLAGVMLATTVGGGVRPEVAIVAFSALPAVYLGGIGSPIGAVVGGLVIGLAQQYAAGYAPDFLGQGFSAVFPFLVLVVVLIVRPQGLFGTQIARRA